MRCSHCKKRLTKTEMNHEWIFPRGKRSIGFCGNACATAWTIRLLLDIEAKL